MYRQMFFISIHAPREGGDVRPYSAMFKGLDFNPRPPRGGRLRHFYHIIIYVMISIHAPREGGDPGRCAESAGLDISIHAPREGGDDACGQRQPARQRFQSTPPARGATARRPIEKMCYTNFNPRPPRGGRLLRVSFRLITLLHFNPRPPRGGRQQRCTVLPADL